MYNQLMSQIMHFATIKDQNYRPNIITFYHDGIFEQNVLGSLKADFYIHTKRPVNATFPLPKNVFPLDLNGFNYFDFVLCVDKLENFADARAFSGQLHCPMVILEHNIRPPHISNTQALMIKNQTVADFYWFERDDVAKSWGFHDGYDIILPLGHKKNDLLLDKTLSIINKSVYVL